MSISLYTEAIEGLFSELSNKYKTTKENIIKKGRKRENVTSRQIICKVLQDNTRLSVFQIGNIINRDHSTVSHSVHTMNDLIDTDKITEKIYNVCEDIFLRMTSFVRYNVNHIESLDPKCIYISGQITGLEKGEAIKYFETAENLLRLAFECEIFNPIKDIEQSDDKTWEHYMLECIDRLFTCDVVYLLQNWESSRGARIEFNIAKELGKVIVFSK